MFRRLLLIALLLEAGLLLAVVPWSSFWDRNYFGELLPQLGGLLRNNYCRGAVTGLGVVNLWAALAELADLVLHRPTHQPPGLSIRHDG